MEKLAATAAQQQQLEPVSAHVDKLTAQLADNKAILDDLDRNVTNIAALKTAADSLTMEAGLGDESAQGTAQIGFINPLTPTAAVWVFTHTAAVGTKGLIVNGSASSARLG